MGHCTLNMHYVNGVPSSKPMPKVSDFLCGNAEYDYPAIDIINEPGKVFKYSGGGFLVLEYLMEQIAKQSIHDISRSFFKKLNLKFSSFIQKSNFEELLLFLRHMVLAYDHLAGSGGISHNTAVNMLYGTDRGCQDFMDANMGLGVFIVEAGDNKFMLHQGANDGFRAIYLYCFAGPDKHKGLSILCNSELNGVVLNSLMTQEILKELNISGIDFSKFDNNFDLSDIPSEEIVNIGYKKLIFDAFLPSLPELIVEVGPQSALAKYNLATTAKILKVSNQKFARAENLLSPYEPVFDPKLFGKQGKIMDSWESARHNENEYDEMLIELKKASEINFISLSTKYHLGNQVQFVDILARESDQDKFQILIKKTHMDGHAIKKIKLNPEKSKWKELLIRIYPDGGFTRLGLYKELPDSEVSNFKSEKEAKCEVYKNIIFETIKPMSINIENLDIYQTNKESNFASLAYGAKIISATDEHYAPAKQVLSPFRAIHMFDGLESKRSRTPGHHEELIFELAESIDIGRIILDFNYFVNNNPVSVKIENEIEGSWQELVAEINVKPFAGNKKEIKVKKENSSKRLKLTVSPDGGINRIFIYKKIMLGA